MSYQSTVLADAPALYWRLGDVSPYSAAVLADTPLAYWPLSESAAPFADASGQGHPLVTVVGTLSPGADPPFAGSGPSCAFSGAGSLQSAGASAGVAPGGDWTIEAWVRPTMPDHVWGSWLYYGTSDESGYIAADIRYDPDVVNQIEAYTTTSPGAILTTELRDGWHHLCFVATAGSIAGYVDGALVTPYGAFASSDSAPTDPIFSIGDIPGWSEQWRGQLAHVAFYDAALAGTRITAHYDAAGTFALADSSGGAQTGTATGAVASGAAGLLRADGNRALRLAGTDGVLVQDGGDAQTLPAAASIECWLRTTTTAGGVLAQFATADGTQRDLTLYLRADGLPAFRAGDTEIVRSSDRSVADGRIHHVVAMLAREAIALADPGFETPVQEAGAFTYVPDGSPWTFASASGISANGSGFTAANDAAPAGAQVALLQYTTQISQDFTVAAALMAQVTFAASSRGGYPTDQVVTVSIDGSSAGVFPITNTPGYQDYSTDPFALDAGTHTLAFSTDGAPDDLTAFIDDVRLAGADLRASLYVDGSLVASAAGVSAGSPFTGRWQVGSGATLDLAMPPLSPAYAGAIDEVAIYVD